MQTERERAPAVVAFYLPQFHPIAENDAWWGAGFTEWRSVALARSLFRGHRQPRHPADLGYCDLRVPETRAAQAALARSFGIDAFCYYHYWFDGKRLLERPFEEVRATGEPDFPFCLCWANESWSRRWVGEERDLLIRQTYSPGDDRAHAEFLAASFGDPRYLRREGRPVFLVYRPLDLPEPARTVEAIRETALARGVGDPFVVGVDAHCPHFDVRALGFDAALRFEPQLSVLGPSAFDDRPRLGRLVRNWTRYRTLSARLEIHDADEARAKMAAARPEWPALPCVFVGWDNTPRRGRRGIALAGGSIERFEEALVDAAARARALAEEPRLLFINAWNEWAEGNALEPDLDSARAALAAVARARLRAEAAAKADSCA